jgi:DNA-binding response OmpR family regulator
MSETVLRGAHILLLEDEALINFATTDILEEMGCRVTACMRLEECFAAIERERPDAAVLDVYINGVLSYDLAEQLHARGTPIVFLTGYASPALTGKWNEFARCLKPCAPVELRALLAKALSTGRDVARGLGVLGNALPRAYAERSPHSPSPIGA